MVNTVRYGDMGQGWLPRFVLDCHLRWCGENLSVSLIRVRYNEFEEVDEFGTMRMRGVESNSKLVNSSSF